MSRKIITGLDIGTYATRVVVSEYLKGDSTPKIIGMGISESLGMRHGYIVSLPDTIKSIKRAVKDAEKNSGVKINQVILAVGGTSLSAETTGGSTIISKVDGEISYADVLKAIESSEETLQIPNKKVVHTIPLLYKLDNKEILGKPEGMHGIKLEVKTLFVTCLKQHLEDLVVAASEAGVDVVDVIASPLAASRVALTEKQKMVGCALVNIGAETLSMAVFEDGNMISLQFFPIGSTDITNDIALGLKIPLDEAEGIKTGSIIRDYSRKKLDEIVAARLIDIFDLISSHLKKIKKNELLPAGVIITGGGSHLSMIEEMAKKILKLPSKVGYSEMLNNGKSKIKDSSWFVAIGLCLMGAESQTGDISSFSINKSIKNVKNFFSSLGKQMMP